jgi:diphosphomevalonate decarboxylase
MQAEARANSNIAFIKYWGNRDERLRLPQNPSLSMNLDGVFTSTRVTWDANLLADELILNNQPADEKAFNRVSEHLTMLRQRFGIDLFARVVSENNFPMGAGIASSASSFAALTVAAIEAAHLNVSERELTTLARLGSGSASRSVPAGFVEWHQGDSHETSYAESFAPVDHWGLVDVIAIVSSSHKEVGSKQGHTTADSSDLQAARVAGAEARVNQCRQAILDHNFATFAEVVELDSNLMHAVMMTSSPPLFYWQPTSLTVMEKVRQLRQDGFQVCYTLDAGPNVHCLCLSDHQQQVEQALRQITGVMDVRTASVGGGAVIETSDRR